jgi:uncharacterized protein
MKTRSSLRIAGGSVSGALSALALILTIFHTSLGSAKMLIPVLIIDGQSGGPYHNWKLTSQVLKKELAETGLFQVTISTSPQFGEDFSNYHPRFSDYKAIVWNYDAPDWPENLRRQFEDYMRSGGGMVVVHAADNAFPHWVAFNQMTGIGGWRNRGEKSGPLWYFKDGK